MTQHTHRPAFTLIELLVVITLIAALSALLGPALASSRQAARASVCLSNARQLAIGLDLYATDEADRYAPGSADALANLDRWHGRRASTNQAFEPARGPLTPYLHAGGGSGRSATGTLGVRACPSFTFELDMLRESGAGFERGSGGYAYNRDFVGTDRHAERPAPGGTHRVSSVRSDRVGSSRARFQSPAGTLAFADGALAVESPAGDVIEYSFAEARFHPHLATPARPDPSIHFRHHDRRAPRASVAYLDGHAGAEPMTYSWSSGLYTPVAASLSIGWPGVADDNDLFDYR